MGDILLLHPDDDVSVARGDLAVGEAPATGLVVRDAIPSGHKIAMRDLPAGASVRKYGAVIGTTTAPVPAGSHVHGHNLAFDGRPGDAAVGGAATDARGAGPATAAGSATAAGAIGPGATTFEGFVRRDGRVGTRNYVAILTSVNCSATVARLIAREAERLTEEFPHVDGIVALTHGSGCGMTTDGESLAILRRTLRGYANHPNVGGVVAVGLGCEVNQLAELGLDDDDPAVSTFTIQGAGGTTAAVRAGVDAVGELLEHADAARRSPVPVSRLTLGLNCGGSDAYSGITANPALGAAVDLLVARGGTAVLAETPEIYGAEHLLTQRAADPAVAERLLSRIRWWEGYTAKHGGTMDNNPSPGNKAGGLTTIAEKSLGAVAKGGSTPLRAVYEYAETVIESGLVFMDTPGYDPVSVTGIVAGGAQVVCFTTGRGSVYGCKPAPSLKLCSNSDTYRRMADDMDVDCGRIVSGDATVEEVGQEIFAAVIDVASGRPTASERLGFGDEEFAPWQLGAVL